MRNQVAENPRLNATDRMWHGKTKRETLGWSDLGDKPTFIWVTKSDLSVDHSYQRNRINVGRVNKIAQGYDWAALGALIVARRKDGTLWVIDGQHRLLASMKRDDATQLPCLVFDFETIDKEAAAFRALNGQRGPIRRIDDFKAALVEGDPAVMAVDAALDRQGYRVSQGQGRGIVSCVESLMKVYRRSGERFDRVLGLVAELYEGQTFPGAVFKGLAATDAYLAKHGADGLSSRFYRDKLLRIGHHQIETHGRNYQALTGTTGERGFAAGVIALLNKGRKKDRVPDPFARIDD